MLTAPRGAGVAVGRGVGVFGASGVGVFAGAGVAVGFGVGLAASADAAARKTIVNEDSSKDRIPRRIGSAPLVEPTRARFVPITPQYEHGEFAARPRVPRRLRAPAAVASLESGRQSSSRTPNQAPIGAPGERNRSTLPPANTFSPKLPALSYFSSKRFSARANATSGPWRHSSRAFTTACDESGAIRFASSPRRYCLPVKATSSPM